MTPPNRRTTPRAPLSNAERQRRFRHRRAARLRELEGNPPLRNDTRSPEPISLRNAPTRTEETIDDALIALRRRGDHLVHDYATLLATPGLTAAEARTASAQFNAWRKFFEDRARLTARRLPEGLTLAATTVTPVPPARPVS